MKQCKGYEINRDNSDAGCFGKCETAADVLSHKLCELCPYNKKYEGMTFQQWDKVKKVKRYIGKL